ncbi:Outer membrane protein assembly factor YaeT precursor [hydrothermal vent metagenome]|uniref:Outer membrane protein assembly factor YaeT n=1 Tax=hydrothermal vent metagenome TaxID=652676 RepID=A0A1W1EE91_9ZZZZ
MIKKILLAWLILGSLLLAQKVTQIKFVGLAQLSPSMAKEIAGINVGDTMNNEVIDDSIKNFFEQGYFKDVWVEKKGGTLIYHFDEKPAIANVEIKGYGSGDDGKKLLEGIGLKKGDLYDESKVARAKKTLNTKLEAKGNYDSVVEVSKKSVGTNAVSIVFEVNKGEKIKIKKLNFIGAKALSQSELETGIVNQEESMFSFIPIYFNSGEVKVDQLEYDAYRVKETYMKHGYLDADVSKPLMRVDYSAYTAEVDYQIKEGPQYRIGAVSVTQSIPGLNTAELTDKLSIKSGRIFSITKLRKDMKMLEEEAGNLGYAYAKASPDMNKDPEKKVVSIRYKLTAGNKVTINDVLISGNDTTKDRVVRRYIYLAPGDKFNAKDLRDSKNALQRTGFFEGVDIQSQRVSDDKINLLVKVKETSTGTISAGGGYGSYEGLMVNASISDKNLFGTGLNTTLGFEISKISKNYNLSFVNPRVWDSMYSLGVSIYKRDYEYIEYTEDQLGGSVNVGREFLRYFYGSVGVGYVDNNSKYNEDYQPTNTIDVDFFADQYKKSSLYASVKFDNTDDYYLPREGFIASVGSEFAQMDGEMKQINIDRGYTEFDNFTKINARFGAYYGLNDWIDYDMILRFKARYTKIISGDDQYIPISERLFMGGIGSVRGYNPYSLSPTVGASRIGGTERASTTVEASVPLSEAAKMRLAFFYDYGVIKTDPVRTKGGSPVDFSKELYGDNVARSSTGVVLEWQSAFGPINLVFSYPIDDEEFDQTASFEFSMGSKF